MFAIIIIFVYRYIYSYFKQKSFMVQQFEENIMLVLQNSHVFWIYNPTHTPASKCGFIFIDKKFSK